MGGPYGSCQDSSSNGQDPRFGPLLDRVDIHIEVPAVPYKELSCERSGEPSDVVRERINVARRRQLERFDGKSGVYANAHMSPGDLRGFCHVTSGADALLKTAIVRLRLSARAYHRVLKIARTIADLAGSERIEPKHVSEAIQYRTLDRGMGMDCGSEAVHDGADHPQAAGG